MKVIISPKASKQLNKLPAREGLKIIRKLRALASTSLVGKRLAGRLQGLYTLRAWPYRIIYRIMKEQKIILVETIEHRQGVYK